MNKKKELLVLLFIGCLSNCQPEEKHTDSASRSPYPDPFGTIPPAARWYSKQEVKQGKTHYIAHCQGCHQPQGRGADQWRHPLQDKTYPPPPLDDTAHAWHHPWQDLRQVIDTGIGHMPAFRDKLSPLEQKALLAYIQSLWSDPIYAIWYHRINQGPPYDASPDSSASSVSTTRHSSPH